MKDIVKQFKESISKLTPEEYKKIWDEIEAEIGTDYPVFNARTNCFEYKVNNTETLELEKAIEENYWNTITLCENSNNTNMGYVEELINTSFINGVKFAHHWFDIYKEEPEYYQVILADNGEYIAVVAKVSDINEEYYPIYGTDIIMSPNPIKWRPIELK